MRILHINTLDQGGAANSCIRLHRSLIDHGLHSRLLVRKKSKNVPESYRYTANGPWEKLTYRARKVLHELRLVSDPSLNSLERAQLKFKKNLPEGSEYFSFPRTGVDVTTSPLYKEADIIHLHWVADFIDYPSFFRQNKKPVVWTLHDMGPFQGGTHYEEKFLGMNDSGGLKVNHVPASFTQVLDENLQIKVKALAGVRDLQIVAPSKWLTEKSKSSTLFKGYPHATVPYGLDTSIFMPRDKAFARELLGLPAKGVCLLFVADNVNNHRKGFAFLRRAFGLLNLDNVTLCAIGLKGTGLEEKNVRLLGRIEDERLMSVAYSAADAFVIPSVEDNLPNTVLESLLCGTPVIGFPVGGIAEMIQDGENGLLSDVVSADALKKAIEKFLANPGLFDRASIRAQAAERFSLSRQANAYMEIYRALSMKLGNHL